MTVEQLGAGLWQWASPHPDWRPGDDWNRMAFSTYLETPDAVVVIDPLVPSDAQDADRFWRALDGDVERLGCPVRVLLTCAWHVRSAAAVQSRYGARVWAPDPGAISSGVDCTRLDDGDRPAVGVEARAVGVIAPDLEMALVLHDHHAVVVGDLIHVGHDGAAVSPEAWHNDSPRTLAWFREHGRATALALLTPPPSQLITGHAPALGGAAVARLVADLGADAV